MIWGDDTVAIEKKEIPPRASDEAFIPGSGRPKPLVGMCDKTDGKINLACKFLDNLRCFVPGSVVRNDHFQTAMTVPLNGQRQ